MLDLNCDLGEIEESWFLGTDKELLNYIDSANISCGAHAGSSRLIEETVALAIYKDVNIGAHPSFQDKLNFGRKVHFLTPDQITDLCMTQINFLKNICKKYDTNLNHVKPHGALYNLAAGDPDVSRAICNAILEIDANLVLYGLAGSKTELITKEMGINFCGEIFADRAYLPGGGLMPRNQSGAVIEKSENCLNQIKNWVETGKMVSDDGSLVSVKGQTICVHGDNPAALEIAKVLKEYLITLPKSH